MPQLVLGHLAGATDVDMRSLVVSGYAAQLAAIQICGKGLYGPFDQLLRALGISSQHLRYRITISVCMFFCFYGSAQMLANRR